MSGLLHNRMGHMRGFEAQGVVHWAKRGTRWQVGIVCPPGQPPGPSGRQTQSRWRRWRRDARSPGDFTAWVRRVPSGEGLGSRAVAGGGVA